MTDIFYVGIDPGVSTGFALLSPDKTYTLKTLTFWQCIFELQELKKKVFAPATIKVFIENPNDNKPVFAKKGADNHLTQMYVAQSVGKNKCIATLLIDYCKVTGIEVIPVKPTTKKWDAITLKQLTGITQKTNQHVRDSIKLIYGR